MPMPRISRRGPASPLPLAWFDAFNPRKRGRRRDRGRGGVPVEPDRPNSLTGGAAAELRFED